MESDHVNHRQVVVESWYCIRCQDVSAFAVEQGFIILADQIVFDLLIKLDSPVVRFNVDILEVNNSEIVNNITASHNQNPFSPEFSELGSEPVVVSEWLGLPFVEGII